MRKEKCDRKELWKHGTSAEQINTTNPILNLRVMMLVASIPTPVLAYAFHYQVLQMPPGNLAIFQMGAKICPVVFLVRLSAGV